MKFSFWTDLARVVAKIGFFTTSFSSTLFLILTIFYVKDKIGSYRYLLTLLPIAGFFFASCEFLLDPFFHSYNGGFTLFRLSTFRNFSLTFNTCILACYVALYASTISVLVLQFTYRYWAVFRPRYIKLFFDGHRFAIPLLYIFMNGLIWWCASVFLNWPDNYANEYLGGDIFDSYGVILSEQPALVLVAYDTKGSIRWGNSFGLLIMTLSLSSQYSVIIYCAVVMGLKMHKKISILSNKMQRMHRQFYHALVIQITAPSLTLFFPVFVLYYVPYLDIEISFPTGTCLSTFAVYPAVDIIIMIYIASYYSKALRDFLNDTFKVVGNKKITREETITVQLDTSSSVMA